MNIRSIEQELEGCFIPVSDTNTEDELYRNRLEKSEIESDLNSNRNGCQDSDNSLSVSKNSNIKKYNSNPHLIYKKEKDAENNYFKNLNTKQGNNLNIRGDGQDQNSLRNKNYNQNNKKTSLIDVKSSIESNRGTKINKPIPRSKSKTKSQQINPIKDKDREFSHQNIHNDQSYQEHEIELLNKKLLENQKTQFQLRQDKILFEEENAVLKLEKEKLSSIKDSQLLTLNEKIMKLEIENSKLLELNEFSKKRLEESAPKVFKYDEVYEKYSKLSLENEKLLENNSTLNSLVQSLKKEKEELHSKFEIQRIETEALKNDKFYLSKESMTLHEKLQSANDKIKNLEEDIREMRKTNQTYLDRLTEKNLGIENSFEEKLRRELEDMKKKYENDKENLKKLFEELSDKRCTYLSEEKEEYKNKSIKYEKIIKDKDETIDFLNTEMRNLTKRTDEELSYLRIQVKIKSEDLERISNLYEENSNILKLLKLENESFKDKNDLLRCELIRKEADYRTELSEKNSQFNILKEKLASYDQMENELDKVILDSTIKINQDQDEELMGIIKDIPTSSKRRISQCLVLANKLKIQTIEIEKLRDMNKKLEEELKVTCDERDLYRNVAEKSKQPYSYLIKNLQEMELENYRRSAVVEEKEQSIKSLLRENDMLNEKLKILETDMKVVLNNRKKLDNLEDIIAQFIHNENETENNNIKGSNSMYDSQKAEYLKLSKTNSSYNLTSQNNYNNMSTKHITSMNMNKLSNQNVFTNNFTKENSEPVMFEIPERDQSSYNFTSKENNKMPKWYMNLKMKEKMKNN